MELVDVDLFSCREVSPLLYSVDPAYRSAF